MNPCPNCLKIKTQIFDTIGDISLGETLSVATIHCNSTIATHGKKMHELTIMVGPGRALAKIY